MADETASDTGPATETAPAETGFDMDAAVDTIGHSLFPTDDPATQEEPTTEVAPTEQAPAPEVPPVRQAPKSWPKEMHEHWAKVDPKVQEYWETREKQMLDGLGGYKDAATFGKSVSDAVTPFMDDIRAQNTDVPTAVQFLFNANRQLTTGTMESRQAAYRDLGARLGIASQSGEAVQVDPHVQALQSRLNQLESGLTARQQADFQAAKDKTGKEVESFWTDPAHPYADEVASDMMPFIHSGATLQDAYDKAVWANPVTRAKEQAKAQTEYTAKLKENARLDALKARTASSSNVRSRDTKRAPTEPLGTMEDTIRETVREMKSRTT